MTPEELDEARAKEAWRLGGIANPLNPERDAPTIAARLAREGWKPPEPVDPDVLAFREWKLGKNKWGQEYREEVLAGKWDRSTSAEGFLAGARMAREQERERAKVLLEYVEQHARHAPEACHVLAKYEETTR